MTMSIEAAHGLDLRTDHGTQHLLWFLDAIDRDRFMREAVGGLSLLPERMILVDPPAAGTIAMLDHQAAAAIDQAAYAVAGLDLSGMGVESLHVAGALWRIAAHLSPRAALTCGRCERPRAACDADPCSSNPRSGHVRETATASELLQSDELAEVFARLGISEPYPVRVIIADCSCGRSYLVAQGDDEYAALEVAHREHVQEMRLGC